MPTAEEEFRLGQEFWICIKCGYLARIFSRKTKYLNVLHTVSKIVYQRCFRELTIVRWRRPELDIKKDRDFNLLNENKFYTVQEVAKILGISEKTLRINTLIGRYPYAKVGRKIVFFEKDLEKIILFRQLNGGRYAKRRKDEQSSDTGNSGGS